MANHSINGQQGSTSFSRPVQSWTQVILAILDILAISAAYLGAFRIRMGNWNLLSYKGGIHLSVAATIVVFFLALVIIGLYRTRPRDLHLDSAWRVVLATLVAWAASVTLTFLVVPEQMAPRSVTAVHWMLSVMGVLGLRGIVRQLLDFRRKRFELVPPGRTSLNLKIGDILDRDSASFSRRDIRDHLSGRSVLVTGAGGSIGSELSRLLISLNPFRLVLVDVSEYNLFNLEKEIRKHWTTSELVFRLADVRDSDIMRTLFANYRPDVIFHAAAYKHVPLMERHPIEAFRNNTLSTVSLVRLCEDFETEQFIFISTDKAVSPQSVLGATKRLAEWYLRASNLPMQRKIVRFGNVFGSQGSVVEIFNEQIASGGPVTVTHPDMSRYFMTGEEACGLILQTLLLDSQIPVYMLRMGDPVKIAWLAKRMIELNGRFLSRPISIIYTGIRPGEKLSETLHEESEVLVPTSHSAIVGLESSAPYSRSELDAHLVDLERLCRGNRTAELRKALFKTDFAAVKEEDFDRI